MRCVVAGPSLCRQEQGQGVRTVSIPKAAVLPILSVARVIAVQLGIGCRCPEVFVRWLYSYFGNS